MEERHHRRKDGESHRSRGSRAHKEREMRDPVLEALTSSAPRSERRRGEDREHRRHSHHHSHSLKERGDDRPERSERFGGDRGERADKERGGRGEHGISERSERAADRAAERERHGRWRGGDERPSLEERALESRPVQIVQRLGGGPVKILGAASSGGVSEKIGRRSDPGGGESGYPANGRPADSAQKKKQQPFVMPAVASTFSKCRLMDEDLRVCVSAVHPHLLESSSEFTVVACIGPQGAGKSTALSLIVASLSGALGKASDGDFEAPLEVHSAQDFLTGSRSRAGIDLCVSTLDRLMLLEAQPLFNYETMSTAELKAELHTLIFLVSICHTLLVVTDTPVDLQLFKFLRLLAMLKTKVPDVATWVERPDDSSARPEKLAAKEVLPRLVIAFNNVGSHMSDAELFKPAQTFLGQSSWKIAPSVQYLRIPDLPGSSLQAMLLSARAHTAGMRLRECVLYKGSERGRFGKDALSLTEREWLYHISGYWDFVQKVTLVQDYFNTITQGLESYGWPKF